MHIQLFGIQGSGKGTQGMKIGENFPYEDFSIGQELRDYSANNSDEKAVRIKNLIDTGKLVTPDLWEFILRQYLEKNSGKNFIFDGVIRTVEQLEIFNTISKDYIILYLDLDKQTAMKRLLGRRMCPVTGKIFGADHRGNTNPENGEKLITRADDTSEAIESRIDKFFEQTLPLLDHWEKNNFKIFKINASQSVEKVYTDIADIISSL